MVLLLIYFFTFFETIWFFFRSIKVCVTCDVWTCRATSFLGMTIHFINANFERESYALAFRPLKGRQTHEILAVEMNKIFINFGLKKEQISNIVTDGCSAFTKSFKKFGLEEPLTSRNQTIEEFPFDDDVDDDGTGDGLPFMQNEEGEIFAANVITLGSDELSTIMDDSLEYGDDEPSENVQGSDIFDGLLTRW